MPEGRDLFKLMEPLMVFGVVGGILIWQWWLISAEIRRDRKKAQEAAEKTAKE